MWRGRTGAGEVRLRIQVAHVICTEEGGVGSISRGHAGLEAHFRSRQPIAHVIEVNRRGTGRGKVFRNAHPENAVGRGAVTTIGHGVTFGVRRIHGEIFRRSDAGETVAADDPADVGRRLRRGRHARASDHILHLRFARLWLGQAEFKRDVGRVVIRRERAGRDIITFQIENEQVEVGRDLRIEAVVHIDRKGSHRSAEVRYDDRVSAGDGRKQVDRFVRAGVLIVHDDVTVRVFDRDDRVERAACVGRDGDDIVLAGGQRGSREGQSHVGIDGVGGEDRVRIEIQHLIVGIVPLEVGRWRNGGDVNRLCHILLTRIRIEVMESALVEVGRDTGEVDVGAIERTRAVRHVPIVGVVVIRADVVPRGGEVAHTGGEDVIDRVADDAIFEKGLVAVTDVVADHVCFEALLNGRGIFITRQRGEGTDVIGKADFTPVGGGETATSFGSHFVANLGHPSAFIGAGYVLENDDRLGIHRVIAGAGQIEIGHVSRSAADAVGDESDTHPGAFVVELGGWVIELVDLIDAMLVNALIERGPEQGQRGARLNAATGVYRPVHFGL